MSRNDSRLAHLWRGLALTSSIALVTLAPAPALAQGDDAGASQPGPFADIPTYRMSAERTHIQPGTVPLETPGLVWSARLASEIHFNPLIVDGTLYLNKDARTQRVWLRDVPGNITKADAKWPAVAKMPGASR